MGMESEVVASPQRGDQCCGGAGTGQQRGGHPRFYEIIQEQADLHSRKNEDYAAGGKQGPLGNFRRVAEIMALWPGMDWSTPFGVAITYALKQLDAAMMLVSTQRSSVTGEPVESRLNDASVYFVIARIIHEEGEARAEDAGLGER